MCRPFLLRSNISKYALAYYIELHQQQLERIAHIDNIFQPQKVVCFARRNSLRTEQKGMGFCPSLQRVEKLVFDTLADVEKVR